MNKLVACSILSVVSLAAQCPCARAASYTYTIINPPHVSSIFAAGINDAGQTTGYYSDPDTKQYLGYVYDSGSFQTIPPPARKPNTKASIPTGIGPTGIVVGYLGSSQFPKPFVFSPGAAASIKLPGAPHPGKVTPESVNASGNVVGTVQSHGRSHAFLDQNGSSVLLDPPGSLASSGYLISDSGIVGGISAIGKEHFSSFTLANNSYVIVSVPKSTSTYIDCLDEQGNTGGTFDYKPGGKKFGAGFTDIGGKITVFSFPGSAETAVLKVISPTENYGIYNMSTSLSAYHYLNGTFYKLAVPFGDLQIAGFNAGGSFTGQGEDPKTNARVVFIATCEAGPGQCTN